MTDTLTTPSTLTTDTYIPEDFRLPAFDLYRDIHKGIRSELFAITDRAGTIDPADVADWGALNGHVREVAEVLELHARHEDGVIEPVLARFDAPLAESIEADHVALDGRFFHIAELSGVGATAGTAEQRTIAHMLYLELTAFTADYFRHQLVEERVVMPMLESHIGFEETLGLHHAIVGSIPPETMAKCLAFMLPAMNVDDRTELLGGMRASAPAEAFAGVVSLARSVLEPADFVAVAGRLGLQS